MTIRNGKETGEKSDHKKVRSGENVDNESGEHDTLVCHQPDSKESVRGLGECPNKRRWANVLHLHCLPVCEWLPFALLASLQMSDICPACNFYFLLYPFKGSSISTEFQYFASSAY